MMGRVGDLPSLKRETQPSQIHGERRKREERADSDSRGPERGDKEGRDKERELAKGEKGICTYRPAIVQMDGPGFTSTFLHPSRSLLHVMR